MMGRDLIGVKVMGRDLIGLKMMGKGYSFLYVATFLCGTWQITWVWRKCSLELAQDENYPHLLVVQSYRWLLVYEHMGPTHTEEHI